MKSTLNLTPQQEAWLRENYKKYMNETLTKMLNEMAPGSKLTEPKLSRFMRSIGLNKRDQEGLTDEQKDFVRENYSDRTVREMATELSAMGKAVKGSAIVCFLQKEKIKKYNNIPAPPKKKKKVRPKADHQNTTHPDRVAYWINLVIEPNRKYATTFQ